jgi:diaminopimelate epimerase
MIAFAKAHAYGNDFLYVAAGDVPGIQLDALARQMCDRHTGIGADGLIVFETQAENDGDAARMRLFNADGGVAEVSGNGVRGLAALLVRHRPGADPLVIIHTDGGTKRLVRTGVELGRQTFRAEMGEPTDLRRVSLEAAGEAVELVTMGLGNPQSVVLGPLPDAERFARLGPAIERHPRFVNGTNVEFAHVQRPDCVRILIWERGVGPTTSSGTGSCAALVAAAAYGGAAREADVEAPGGVQRVEWLPDSVFLTGWAEVLCDGQWLRSLPG